MKFLYLYDENKSYELLIFVNLYQHGKSHFIPPFHSSDTINFRVSSHDWPHPFLTMPTPRIPNHLSINMNLYQHAKYQLNTSIDS